MKKHKKENKKEKPTEGTIDTDSFLKPLTILKPRVDGSGKGQNIISIKGIETIDYLLSWLFIVVVGVLPLLVKFKIIDFAAPKMIDKEISSGLQGDIFTYYKWCFLIFITIISILFLVVKIIVFHYELRRIYINIPLFVLALFTILSSWNAEYMSISLIGIYNRHEGAIAYLCYFSLLFVAANTCFKERFLRYIFTALSVLVSIEVIIILLNFYDVFQSQILSLIIPANMAGEAGGSLNSTLNNPNYVSGFSAAVTAFFLIASVVESDMQRSLTYAFFSVISFILVLASLSTTGFYAVMVIMPFVLAMALISSMRIKTLTTIGGILVSFVFVFVVLNAHNSQLWDKTFGSIKENFGILKKEISLSKPFYLMEAEAAQVSNSPTSIDDFSPLDGNIEGYGRLDIWRETINLIKKKPILGYGHDTLVYYFSQNRKEIVTKPHNMYLEVAYGSGLIALLSLAALIFLHFFYTVRLLKKYISDKNTLPLSLFAFWCAFLLQWITNDSINGTAPIFWSLFGVAASINYEIAN